MIKKKYGKEWTILHHVDSNVQKQKSLFFKMKWSKKIWLLFLMCDWRVKKDALGEWFNKLLPTKVCSILSSPLEKVQRFFCHFIFPLTYLLFTCIHLIYVGFQQLREFIQISLSFCTFGACEHSFTCVNYWSPKPFLKAISKQTGTGRIVH